MDTIGQQPPSPGLSSFLADLAADDADDASYPMEHNTNINFAFGSSAQPQLFPAARQDPPCPGNIIHPGMIPGNPPGAMDLNWSPLSGPVGPTSVKPGPMTATGFAWQSAAPINRRHSGTAAGSRRGRKPALRLPDLQQQLDALSEQFKHLSQENTFLRGKLKLLERILPHRASHVGFLAAVRNGQPQHHKLTYSQLSTRVEVKEAAAAAHSAAQMAALTPAATQDPAATAATPLVATAGSPVLSCPEASPWSTNAAAAAGSYTADVSISSLPTVATATPTVTLPPPAAALTAPDLISSHTTAATATTAVAATPALVVATACGSGFMSAPALAAAAGRPLEGHPSVDGGGGGGGGQDGSRNNGGYEPCWRPPAAADGPVSHSAAMSLGSWATAVEAKLPGLPVVVALCPGPDGEVPTITPAAVEQLKAVTPRDFQLLYKHCVQQLAVLGVAAEVHGPSSAQHGRLERFLERIFTFMDQVLLLSPNCFVQSMYVNVETGQQERPSDDFWSALGSSLNLTPQQLEDVLMARDMHERNVAPVAQERARLTSELSASLSAAVSQQPVSSGDVIKTLSEVDEVAERLRRNVIREHRAQMDVEDFVCMSVLSPVQVARVMAASYPYIPDGVAVLHACGGGSGGGTGGGGGGAKADYQQAVAAAAGVPPPSGMFLSSVGPCR